MRRCANLLSAPVRNFWSLASPSAPSPRRLDSRFCGGPVFLMAGTRQSADGLSMSLGRFLSVLGLVSQEQEIKERIQSLTEITERTHRLALAVVVHAQFIRETIDAL